MSFMTTHFLYFKSSNLFAKSKGWNKTRFLSPLRHTGMTKRWLSALATPSLWEGWDGTNTLFLCNFPLRHRGTLLNNFDSERGQFYYLLKPV